MTPILFTTSTIRSLKFEPVTAAHLPLVARYLALTDSRTCDYTIGGIYLWIKLFGYELCEINDLLIIRGRQENDLSIPAFSLPLGPEDNIGKAVRVLAEWNQPLRFSAIPEDRLHLFAEVGCTCVNELGPDWSDYIYDIDAMATLSGNAMKRKRNHVNRFKADNPGWKFVELKPDPCRELLNQVGHDGSPMGKSEFDAVASLLDSWDLFAPYLTGRMLLDDSGRTVAFTVCELKDDTLHVHIEKADHSVSGSGESVAHMLCEEMKSLHPELIYVNRQDNAGDEGLRLAKESWHPLRLLPKFNVTY